MTFSECKWLKFYLFSPVADRYSIDGLKQYATFTISMKLDSTNVVDIYVDSVTQLPVIGKRVPPIICSGRQFQILPICQK